MRTSFAAQATTIAVCPQPLLDQLLDKRKTLHFMASADLPIPQPVDPAKHDFTYPLLGKPLGGWGGRGIETLASHSELERLAASVDLDAYVWSPRLDVFEEYSADFAIGPNSSISPITMRRRLRTSGGFAVVSESADDPELATIFSRTAQALAASGGFGLFNVQAINAEDRAIPPFISDINPRIGTSATHALNEGSNLPAWFMASTNNEPPGKEPTNRRRVKSVRLLRDITVPMLAKRPRGVVFDLDDTLVDHKRWLLAKMQALYDAHFSDHVGASDYLRAVIQLIDDHEWARLIDRVLELLCLPAAMRDKAIEIYRGIEIQETPLFDDVAPVMSGFHDAGIKVAILTDNPPATQRAKIAHAAALRDVGESFFSREHGGEKPNRMAFAQVARALECAPGELVMVGDNWMRDCEGAIRSGYAHAFAVHRGNAGDSSRLARSFSTDSRRISEVPGLVPVLHACLDAPA
jgi:FMN phosphatase YigB (HAD superfamily)